MPPCLKHGSNVKKLPSLTSPDDDTDLLTRGVGDHGEDGVHGEGEVHVAGAVVGV